MSNLQALVVPKWGMAMEEGDIAEWRIAEGESVSVDDEVVDIETSKIVNTAQSGVAGTLVRQVAQVGETLKVGALLGVIAQAETTSQEVDEFIRCFSGSSTSAADTATIVHEATDTVLETEVACEMQPVYDYAEGPDDSDVKAVPTARRLAVAHNINLNNVTATGVKGRISKQDVEAAIADMATKAQRAQVVVSVLPDVSELNELSEININPVAKRLAKKLGVDLADVAKAIGGGRISKRDVENFAKGSGANSKSSEDAVQSPVDVPVPPPKVESVEVESNANFEVYTGIEVTKLSGMRKTIATRLSQSKQNIPHYRVSVDIEIDELQRARKALNEKNSLALSVNDFIVKASACALSEVPSVNVQFVDNEIHAFKTVDISLAVAIEGGLITPVIRQADQKGLAAISAEAKDLASRAVAGKLGVDEIQGGTFSISNLGMFGVDQFDAIINLPQAAILAVGAGKRKPIVKNIVTSLGAEETIGIATVMRVSLSSDHRVVDGAVAAEFLQVLKRYIEEPTAMLL